MKTPKCYTWLESCGSHLSGSVKKNIYFCILQRVRFSRTLRTDIFLYTEKLSKAMRLWMVIDHWSIQRKRQHWSVEFAMHTKPWRRPTSIMVCTANWTKLLGLSTARMQVWEHTVEKSQRSATDVSLHPLIQALWGNTSIMPCTANKTKLLGLSTTGVQVDPEFDPFFNQPEIQSL